MVTNTNHGKRMPLAAIVALLVIAAVVIALLRQSTGDAARNDAAQLAAENAQLKQELAGMRTAMAAKHAAASKSTDSTPVETAPVQPVSPQQPANAAKAQPFDDRVLTPTGMAKPPRSDGLMLAGAHAVPTEGGIKATMTFSPTTADPMGIVAVVVRLPRDSESKIAQFGPSAPAMFGDLVSRISEDGKFAIFQGTAQKLESLELALAVSTPVVADVRGTCGVGAFKLDVKTTGASIQK